MKAKQATSLLPMDFRESIKSLISDSPKSLRSIVHDLQGMGFGEQVMDLKLLINILQEIGAYRTADNCWCLDTYTPLEPSRAEVQEETKKDKKIQKLQNEKLAFRKKYQELLSRVRQQEKAESERESVFYEETRVEPFTRRSHRVKEATPLVLASDWHAFKIIEPYQVENRNRYNAAIARERSERFFQKVDETNRMLRHSYTINQLVLWLGGDMMENWLHDGDARFTEGTPSQEVAFVRDLLEQGIKLLLEDSALELIHVPCSVGNHGRFPNAKKMSMPDPVGESMEWLLYEQLAKLFEDDPRVQFSVPSGEYTYFHIYDWPVRASHGFQVKPSRNQPMETALRKYIYEKNQTEIGGQVPALDIVGHVHTLRTTARGASNGSLVGEDPFANRMRFPPERPQQLYQLCEQETGFTMPIPLLVD